MTPEVFQDAQSGKWHCAILVRDERVTFAVKDEYDARCFANAAPTLTAENADQKDVWFRAVLMGFGE